VVTAEGPGKVLAQELLAKRVLVEFEDGRRRPVPLADVLTNLYHSCAGVPQGSP
jgi:hypothetical protein